MGTGHNGVEACQNRVDFEQNRQTPCLTCTAAARRLVSRTLLSPFLPSPHSTMRHPLRTLSLLLPAAWLGGWAAMLSHGMDAPTAALMPQGLPVSKEWLLKSTESEAVCMRGVFMMVGAGMPQNEAGAVECFRQAAEMGLPAAQCLLSACYFYGVGVEKNVEEDVRWRMAAAAQNDPQGQMLAAACYMDGYGVEMNIPEALRLLRAAAEAGETGACIRLALLYRYGNGVEQDTAEARKWYRVAAEDGSVAAMDALGKMALYGEGADPNPQEGVTWFMRAAESGMAVPLYNVGTCYEYGMGVQCDHTEAAKWYHRAAEKGYADAHSRLGTFYTYGTQAVRRDADKGLYHHRMAVLHGSVNSLNALGVAYETGRGVPKYLPRAFAFYLKAAELGDHWGQYNVGRFYRFGLGSVVPVDYAKALEWFRKAADQGDAHAQACLGHFYMTGLGVERNFDEAYLWTSRSAQSGENRALLDMGLLYEHGWGVEQNAETAVSYYKMLADAIDHSGLYEMGRCYYRGIGVERDLSKAFLYWRDSMGMRNGEAACCLGLCRLLGIGGRADLQGGIELLRSGADNSVAARYNLGLCYEAGYGVPRNINAAVRYYLRATRSETPCARAAEALKRLGVEPSTMRDTEGFAFTVTKPARALRANALREHWLFPFDMPIETSGATDEWQSMQPASTEPPEPAPEPDMGLTVQQRAKSDLDEAEELAQRGDMTAANLRCIEALTLGNTHALNKQACWALLELTPDTPPWRAKDLLIRAKNCNNVFASRILHALDALEKHSSQSESGSTD